MTRPNTKSTSPHHRFTLMPSDFSYIARSETSP